MKAAVIQQNIRNQSLGGSTTNAINKIHSEYSPLSTKKAVLYQIIDLNKTEDGYNASKKLSDKLQNENISQSLQNVKKNQIEVMNSNRSFLYSCKTINNLQEAKNDLNNSNIDDYNNFSLPLNKNNSLLDCLDKNTIVSKPPNIIDQVDDDDSRVTGGGSNDEYIEENDNTDVSTTDKITFLKKLPREGNSPRKVSFKIRSVPAVNRRATSTSIKTTTKLNCSKVAELTMKFNEMIKEKDGILNRPKFARVVEKIQSKTPESNSSTPSSTLISGTNIKIVTKIKPTPKKKLKLKKKSASVSTADSTYRKKVQRVKSDGHPQRHNSIRKKTLSSESSNKVNNQFSNNSIKITSDKDLPKIISKNEFLEKVKRFESCSTSKSFQKSDEIKDEKKLEIIKPLISVKPVVPEKKNSIMMTKNIVLRDGKPKIKLLKPKSISLVNEECSTEPNTHHNHKIYSDNSKKENIYDKIKFRTKILKGGKLQLLKSEESISNSTEKLEIESLSTTKEKIHLNQKAYPALIDKKVDSKENDNHENISATLKPNASFLWNSDSVKREQIYYDLSKMFEYEIVDRVFNNTNLPQDSNTKNNSICGDNNLYQVVDSGTVNILTNETDLILKADKQEIVKNFKHDKIDEVEAINDTTVEQLHKRDSSILAKALNSHIFNDDKVEIVERIGNDKREVEAINVAVIEQISKLNASNLAEAINSQIIDNFTSKSYQKIVLNTFDDDYEPLEPFRETTEAGFDQFESSQLKITSLSSCPLPPLPSELSCDNDTDNIYQCLSELRSHPEGDDCGPHNYDYCPAKLTEQRTRGDRDSDDGYEYYKADIPTVGHQTHSTIQQQPLPQPNENSVYKGYVVNKSVSNASSIGYEKIYEKIVFRQPSAERSVPKSLPYKSESQPRYTDSITSYETLNGNENVYDTIKHSEGDAQSIANCYESIPNSPHSVVKLRNKSNIQHNNCPGKRLSFDTVSNFSHSTISSEQKTNSIYGQRSVVGFGNQETVSYGPAASEISLSDRSDDWVDVSDADDRSDDNTIVIIRERARGRRSPTSWSQKVRHQWHNTPKKSDNGGESSNSEHYYESLHPTVEATAATYDDDDIDSFASDSDNADTDTSTTPQSGTKIGIENSTLPAPPSTSHNYTLTKFASAASKKMRNIKENLTKSAKKRYSGTSDSTKSPLSNSVNSKSTPSLSNSIFARLYEPKMSRQKSKSSLSPNNTYENTNFSPTANENLPNGNQIKTTSKIYGSQQNIYPATLVTLPSSINYESATQLNLELKNALNEKRLSLSKISADTYKPISTSMSNRLDTNDIKSEKASAMSRNAYLSFKAKFRRSDIFTDVPSALKITNSTFYLTDSVDVDSGFSNCSDSGQTVTSSSTEAIQPTAPLKKNDSTLSQNINSTDKENIDSDNGKDCTSIRNDDTNQNSSPVDRRKPKSRPLAPPPPPPEAGDFKRLFPSFSKKDKQLNSTTSWYAECGLFAYVNQKQGPPTNGCKERPSSTSWYAEVGLYQAGNISTSSSGASSSSSMMSPPPPPSPPPLPPIHGRFQQEPLYQFYNAAKVESVCREHLTDSDSDGYEEITDLKNGDRTVLRPSAMALVSPLKGPSRTLWCEIPEVVNSAVLSSLSSNQKKLQEAKFEIITSEASYLNSLTVLEKYFINHPGFRDESVMSKVDHNILFGTILSVKKCSELFMNELEECWQDNILLYGLGEILKKYAEQNFHVYITYCENQIFLVKTLLRLKNNASFGAILSTLESQSACHGLSLHSFLMLPMQRATRLPLLVDAVLKNLDRNDDECQIYADTLATLNNFVSECNEGARNMERVDEMYRISSYIEFPSHLNNPPDLAPSCVRSDNNSKVVKPKRWLVRSGEVTQLMWRGDEISKLTFGKKFTKMPISLFLFTDVLIVAKKHSDESYSAIDYCNRSLIEMSSGDVMGQKENAGKFTMLLTLLENHEKKTLEMLIAYSSETDRQRWIEAFSAPTSSNPEETVYGGWDCPQVAAIYPYQPMQPDELALQEGDIVNVTKKMADGWYHGERITDGRTGWFPGNYACEIASPHVRARNIRQRYRLLALSGSYLGQQRKK